MMAVLDKTLSQILLSFQHNWPYLLLGVIVAAILQVYLDSDKVVAFLRRHSRGSVWASVGAATFTPLCSCGTTAVILGMMASTVPWAPIVAFMVSSPLVSPGETLYAAGLFGWPFATALVVASIALGLLGGWLATRLEAAGWLKNQARFRPISDGLGEGPATVVTRPTAGGSSAGELLEELPVVRPSRLPQVFREMGTLGLRILLFFFGFAFIGYFMVFALPNEWMLSLFGEGRRWGVPLAATLGLPLYFNTEASLPLVRSFLEMGMSPGAALAFIITGAGTSVGAITGALTIARWRVVAVVIGTLWIGAILAGVLYNLLGL